MFDEFVGSQTVQAGDITVVLDAGNCDSVALFDLQAVSVYLELTVDEVVIWSQTVRLLQENSACWTDYFFGLIIYGTDLQRSFPIYGGSKLKIVITPADGNAAIGQCVVGRTVNLGDTTFENPKASINDYSKKSTDSFGRTYLAKGEFSKGVSCKVLVDNSIFDYVYRMLSSFRATPVVWNFNNDTGEDLEAFILYGYYSSFDLVIPGPKKSTCSLEVEGLI